MPVFWQKHIANHADLAIWKVTRDSAYMQSQLSIFPEELSFLERLSPRKKKEWLASRLILKSLLPTEEATPCLYDQFGKPYLVGLPLQLSVSHSEDRVAVILAKRRVGIDIQKINPKIERIQSKFLNAPEADSLGAESIYHLHVYWGAKEALFKAYGRNKVDFKAHLRIQPFVYQAHTGNIQGAISKSDGQGIFDIYYQLFDSFMLTYAIEQIQ